MIAKERLATAHVPGQDGLLELVRHDRDFSFRVHGVELMSSRVHGSEELLAELALERIADRDRARVAIGGLGMGFTLAATLRHVGADARVDVAELVSEVVDWNRTWLGELNGDALEDPRTSLFIGDVADLLGAAATSRYDAILLDVDNGPKGLTRAANDRLYGPSGLATARASLRPGGVLAIWSAAHEEPRFADRLRRAGFAARAVRVRARRTKGPRHTIWLASIPPDRPRSTDR